MKRKPFIRKISTGLIVGFISTAVAAGLYMSGFLEGFEYQLWDLRQRWMREPGEATDDIAVILLDQNSLDWAKEENGLSWPWPREIYTYIINFVGRGNPRALAFDVLFSEPSTYGVYDDDLLGQTIDSFGPFVGSLFLSRTDGSFTEWPPTVPVPRFEVEGMEPFLEKYDEKHLVFPKAAFPVPQVAENSMHLSNVNLRPDSDGVFRRAKLFTRFDGKTVPSCALALYAAALSGSGREAPPVVTAHPRTNKIVLWDIAVPLDSEGNAVMRSRGPSGTHETYSAASVIQSEIQRLSGEGSKSTRQCWTTFSRKVS